MNIRPAKPGDYESIRKIRYPILSADNSSDYTLSQRGFLVGDYSLEEFNHDLDSAVFLVALEDEQIIGHIVLSETKEYPDNGNKIWNDDKYKKRYYSADTIEVKVIFISPKYTGKGIGSKLMKSAIEALESRYKNIASIITIAPVINYKSLNYHLSKGFKIAAISLPKKVFEIEDYQSALLINNLE